jgi:hypothetical protein
MSNTGTTSGHFKPASLGIMFLTFGLALIKMGDLSTLSSITALTNNLFMWISFVLSTLCLILLIPYIASMKIRVFMNNQLHKYMYHIALFYLFVFAVNWSLNLNNTETDLLFHLIFWLGFLWFLVMLFILLSSVPVITKYITSGLFMGASIQPLLIGNYLIFIIIFATGLIMFFVALKNWNISEYYPLY